MIGDVAGKGGYTYRLSPDIRTVTIVDGPQNVGKTYSTASPVGRAILAEINGYSASTLAATVFVLVPAVTVAIGLWIDASNKADQRRESRRRRIRPRRR